MDLNTIEAVVQPAYRSLVPPFRPGDALLAGGTWLFSEPQTGLTRLVDLMSLGWRPLHHDGGTLEIAATCTLAELEAFEAPQNWHASPLVSQCCRALLGSFKIRKMATVGGNLCLALAAAPMAAFLAAMGGICTIWTQQGGQRHLAAVDFVIGANLNALLPGEILRAITLPARNLQRRSAFRQTSLTELGRSAALLIGTREDDEIELTITASVARPVQIRFSKNIQPAQLADDIEAAISVWYDDIHGAPAWRRQITHLMAAEILAELSSP